MIRTATQIITRALRVARVIGLDQVPSATSLAEGLLVLQSMLDEWHADTQLHDVVNNDRVIDDGVGDWTLPLFDSLLVLVTVPDGLTVAIEYGLAVRLSWEHGSEISPRVGATAAAALNNWRAKVAASQVPKLKPTNLHSTGYGYYNIYTDSFDPP